MKSYSLIFRLVLVFYSAIHIDTVTAVKRRGELFKFNLLRFNRKDSEPFDQPEFDISNEEWERHSLDLHPESSQAPTRWTLFGNSKRLPPRYPPPRLPPSQLPPPRLPFPMPKLPKESEKQTYPSFSEVVDEIFPGLSHTDRPAASKTKENVNEIHVQVNDVADLTNILGYDDIVFSVKNSEPGKQINFFTWRRLNDVVLAAVIPRPDIGNHRGEIPSKPFWGPPIGSLSTRPNLRPTEKPTTRPYTFTTDADFSSDLSSTVNNVWELTTSGKIYVSFIDSLYRHFQENVTTQAVVLLWWGSIFSNEHFTVPRNPSEGRSNEAQNNKPTESFWGPDPFGPPFAEHKNPFDSNFWNHEATSTEPTSLNDPTSESQFPKSSESGQHNYFGETASAASPPVIQETECNYFTKKQFRIIEIKISFFYTI